MRSLMLAAVAAFGLGIGSAYASEGQYVSPITGEPTELVPATRAVVPTQRATAPVSSDSTMHVFSATHGGYSTDPSLMRMLFPETVFQD